MCVGGIGSHWPPDSLNTRWFDRNTQKASLSGRPHHHCGRSTSRRILEVLRNALMDFQYLGKADDVLTGNASFLQVGCEGVV